MKGYVCRLGALAGAALSALLWLPATGAPDATKITFFSLDEGDATLVQLPGDHNLLLGAGAKSEGTRMIRWLKAHGILQLDALLVQTWRDTHLGGAADVLKSLPVRQVLLNPCKSAASGAAALDQVAASLQARGKLTYAAAIPGDRQTLNYSPFCQITAVGPTGAMQRAYRSNPNCSLVLEIRHDRMAFLSLGESGVAQQRSLWKEVDPAPWGQILQVGQAGGAAALDPAILRQLKTRVAVIPVPRRGKSVPAAATLAALRKAGVKVYRTDRDRTVTVTTDGSRISVATGLAGP